MTLPNVASGDAHVAAHNAERGVINQLFPAGLTDGQLSAWSASANKFVAVNPSGAAELAAATNYTNAHTSCTATGGQGASVDIPATGITVPNSNGRPVTLHFQANAEQTALGTGRLFLQLVEYTSGADVVVMNAIAVLPNAASNADMFLGTISAQYRIGAVTTPRMFKLRIVAWATSGSPAVETFNAIDNPTLLRAVAG